MNVGTAAALTAPARRRRPGARDLAILAALLALPVLPILRGAADEAGWLALGGEARMHLDAEAHTRRALAEGQLPLWNPYEFGGRPHLADPDTLALYVPHVVLRFLPIDAFFIVSFVFHAWLFGAGAYLTARELGAPRAASLLASTGVALATVVNPWAEAPYTPRLYALAWLPLVVGLSIRSLRVGAAHAPVALVAAAAAALTGPVRGQLYAVAAIGLCHVFWAVWPDGRAGRARPVLGRLAFVVSMAAGLAAFQLAPHARYWTTAHQNGGFVRQDVRARSASGARPERQRLVAAALASPGGERVLAQCDDALDASGFLRFGIPGIEGYGGAFPADYGRYARLVSDTRGEPSHGPAAMRAPVRGDLLALLNVGYTVGCSPPLSDEWTVLKEIEGAVVTKARVVLPRAFWTCAPRRVTREELDYRLRTSRYDETVTLYEANPVVHVRWTAAVATDERARRGAETSLRIRLRRFVDDRTWQYDLIDPTRANLAAIVNHPGVEDTAGFDRGALAFQPAPEPPVFSGRRSEWLLGIETCQDVGPASIERMDRADGGFVATVDAPRDGVVFLSETYFAGRAARLDGVRVDAIKVNLAFTGIPVAAGVHRIELRADPAPLWAGAGVTLLTLVGWTLHGWRAQRH
jgi:hypothetical protein